MSKFLSPGKVGVYPKANGLGAWKQQAFHQDLATNLVFQVHDGKVDFILEHDGQLILVEVKWTERPSTSEAQHLLTFLKEHPRQAQHGFVICRCSLPMQPHHRITALPWLGV